MSKEADAGKREVTMKTFTDEQIIEWLKANNKKLYNYEEIEKHFERELDDSCGDVQIGTLSYSTGEVLRKVDPVAFRCGVNELIDAEYVELADGDKYVFRSDYDEAIDALIEIAELAAMEEAENEENDG